MDSILETGTVTALEQRDGKQVALIVMDMSEESQERCATCSACSKTGDGCLLLAAEIEANLDVAQGTRVEVEISRPSLYVPVLVTLVIPLVGMTAGGILGSVLGAGYEWRDLLSVGLALVFGAVLFGAGYILLGKRSRDKVACAKVKKVL